MKITLFFLSSLIFFSVDYAAASVLYSSDGLSVQSNGSFTIAESAQWHSSNTPGKRGDKYLKFTRAQHLTNTAEQSEVIFHYNGTKIDSETHDSATSFDNSAVKFYTTVSAVGLTDCSGVIGKSASCHFTSSETCKVLRKVIDKFAESLGSKEAAQKCKDATANLASDLEMQTNRYVPVDHKDALMRIFKVDKIDGDQATDYQQTWDRLSILDNDCKSVSKFEDTKSSSVKQRAGIAQ